MALRSARQTKNPDAHGYVQLIAGNRDFRLLWCGQIVSLFGDWFNLIASAALVARFTGSGLAVGTLFVVRMVAHFVASPAAGVAADRYPRKSILVAADLLRAVVVLGFLFVTEPSQLWLLYTLTSIQLATSGFFYTARNAILADIVAPEGLAAANALSSATWSVMLAVGAALGGLVTGVFGTSTAFVVDAASFGVSALLIVRVRGVALATAGEMTMRSALRAYVEGLAYLRDHVDSLVVSLHKAAASLCMGAGLRVVHVALAEGLFAIGQGGGTSLGLLFAVNGIGTGFGPIVARALTGDRDHPLRQAMAWSYAFGAAGLLVTATLWSFTTVLFGALLCGVAQGIAWVFSTQLLLHQVPNRVLGRVFGMEFAVFTLASAVGAACAGVLMDVGLAYADILVGMAALTLLPGLLWGAWMRRHPPVSLAPPRGGSAHEVEHDAAAAD